MTLRARLVIAFTTMLVLAIAVLGVAAARSSRLTLIAQVDEDLQGIQLRLAERPGVRPVQPGGSGVARGFASIVIDDSGEVVEAVPSGFSDDPDPLPDVAALEPILAEPGDIATVPSSDGSLDYRAIAVVKDGGTVEIGAVPIADVDAAVNQLVWWLIAAGLIIAAAGGVATWWIVRRGLRPVDAMVDTAASIAAGDLTRRVPEHGEATELGQLGAALNDMLGQIDTAFAHERLSQQRLNQFIADASHELRTPLSALQGYADLYRKGALQDPDELDAAMQRIHKESARMQRLVDDLLLLARLDRGQTLDRVPVDVVAVVRDAITDSRAIEPDRPVEFHGPPSAVVAGDEQRLAQIITNLLANTRAHTAPATSAEVIVETAGSSVNIHVIDDGPGIPDDQLGTVFDRFHRGESPTGGPSSGTGLGLAIVAAIIEAHDGAVTATNEPGRGARFTVTMAAAEADTRNPVEG